MGATSGEFDALIEDLVATLNDISLGKPNSKRSSK
jgi:hypothetical protein